MYLIPKPKKIEKSDEALLKRTVCLKSEISDLRLIKALKKLDTKEAGIPLYITGEKGDGEGYRLSVSNESIRLDADGAPGVFYAVQTLRQIFANDEIYCVDIEDKPGNTYRGFFHDITRGKVPKVGYMKWLIDNMAYYKMNSLQFYMEHAFAFKEMGEAAEESKIITPEEIREIDDYCYENFIDFIPAMATCGHLYELLQLPQNAHLRELEEYEPEYVFWYERMLHHTIDPENPESLEFVKSLIDQYIPLFRSEYVNICGDEPWDLKIGKHKDKDPDKVYFDFMRKVIGYVKSKGKRVIMWADKVFLDNAERATEIPDDVTMLCWGYMENPPEERVKKLENRKNRRLVCPSTSTFYRLTEHSRRSEINISKMAEYGLKYGADGMLNTNWGDYGHPCSLELSMFGMLAGAEKSWDFSAAIDDSFKSAANYLLYKNKSGIKYLFELNRLSEYAVYYKFVRYYSNLTCKGHIEVELPTEEDLKTACEGCKELAEELSAQSWTEDEFRKEMIVAAEGTAVIAELFARNIGYSLDRWTDTEQWLKKYRSLWLKKNKESELYEIEKMFRFMEDRSVRL